MWTIKLISAETTSIKLLLESVGLEPAGVLIIHSSFSALSHQGVRAEDFIEELLAYLGSDGTLLMPSMSWRNVQSTNPLWDELHTPSHVGILSEVFRTQYAQRRSIHPTHSVSGIGKHADFVLGSHHIDDLPCSSNSPFGLLSQTKAKILLIDVELDVCTAIHCAEDKITGYKFYREQEELYYCRERNGNVKIVKTRRHKDLKRNFPLFEPLLLNQGVMKHCKYKGVHFRLIDAYALQNILHEIIKKDPHATLHDDVKCNV